MSVNKNKKSDFRTFFSYYKPYRGLFAADMISSVAEAVLSLILPLCVRHITNDILGSGNADVLPGILRTGMVMLAIIIAKTGFGIFYDYMGHVMGARIERDLRKELFEHYQKLPFSFFDGRNTGELMSRLSNDLHNLSEVYHHVPEMILTYGIQVIGSVVILLWLNWKLALVVFAAFPFIAAYTVIYNRKLQRSYKVNRECIAAVNSAVQENLSGIRVVKSFANEEAEKDKFAAENNRYYESRAGIYKSEALLFSAVEHFFTPLITIAIVTAGGMWISTGTLDIPSLLVFIMYAAYLTGPVPSLANIIPFYLEGFTGYSRFRELMDITPDIRDADNAAELKPTGGRVEFRDVAFRYSDEHEYVLRGINLDVKAGETVAIVGRSGIGKTTLCSLIPRFYEVNGGGIFIDGTDIRGVTQRSLREHIGVVGQETFLFAGTVMENILYGKPGASQAEAIQAAKRANAHEFITGLPNGYDTDIGQRGIKLSGGQRQRISIARVFLKNPPILIFDEATSSLDNESEKAVLESLSTLTEGRTAFIIAHRLSTIKSAGRIIVLTDEGIAEQGAHEELMERDGAYSRLYNALEA